MEEGKQMTILGMALIVGLVALALLVIRWMFGQPSSGSDNLPHANPDARAEGN